MHLRGMAMCLLWLGPRQADQADDLAQDVLPRDAFVRLEQTVNDALQLA
jgi:hypothetical protein